MAIRIDAAKQFATFALTEKGQPLFTCVVAFGSADQHAWQEALGFYGLDPESHREIADAPLQKPAFTPWLSTQLHRGMKGIPHEELKMAAHFQHSLAWAIIDNYRRL